MRTQSTAESELQAPSDRPARTPEPKPRFEFLALLIVALLLTALVYIAALRFAFVYDDRAEIVNDTTLHSWRYLRIYFTSHLWQYSHPEALPNYYRPLPMIWKLVHYTIFGLHPFWWHLSNILVHTLMTLLVFVLARRMTRDDFLAVAAAFVFGVHPVHVEAVAWVSGITDLLLALLLVSAFVLHVDWRATEPPRINRRYCLLLSLLLYALGTLTKETAIVFPGLIFFWGLLNASAVGEPWDLRGLWVRHREATKAALPYLAVTIVYLSVRISVLKGFSHVATPMPLLTIILTSPSLIWFYIKSLVYPSGLSLFYDVSVVTRPGWINTVVPVIGIASFVILCWRLAKGSPAGMFAILLMLLPLLPVLNPALFNSGGLVHDRFLYLPSVGFAILAGLAIKRLKQQRFAALGQPRVGVAAVLIVACLFGVLTATQVQYWQDEVELYARAVRIAPLNSEAANNLACALEDRGFYQEALDILDQVNSRDPGYWNTVFNIGYISYKMNDFNSAAVYLRRALQMDPHSASANFYLGLVFVKTGHLDESEASIRKALELGPVERGFYGDLGAVLEIKGSRAEALDAYKQEVTRFPDQVEVLHRIEVLEAMAAPSGIDPNSGLSKTDGSLPHLPAFSDPTGTMK